MKILVISDIHANFSALSEIIIHYPLNEYDCVINPGDSLVYGPHPNETLDWLRKNNAISILGNTDKKIIRLLKDKSFRKPSKPEKRVMYHITAKLLSKKNQKYLKKLGESVTLPVKEPSKKGPQSIGIYHGSPEDPDEFLFSDTSEERFTELAATTKEDIIITGHSHTPYYKVVQGKHFINPGSVGRMFDGDPRTSFAEIIIDQETVKVHHHRLSYPIQEVVSGLQELELPDIYSEMFLQGRKLN